MIKKNSPSKFPYVQEPSKTSPKYASNWCNQGYIINMACNLGYTAVEERNQTNEMKERQSVTMMSRDNSVTEIYLSPRYRPKNPNPQTQ